MPGSVIVAGARTPIGKLSGALAGFIAMELGGFAIAAALERAGIAPDEVDYVFMGQVLQAGQGQITARQAAVKAGIPMSVPATTVNKVCLSGLNAIYLADLLIASGDADVVVAGGMESMTEAPHLLAGARAGYRLGDGTLVDSMMHDGLYCQFDHCAMGSAPSSTTAPSASPASARTRSPPSRTSAPRPPSKTAGSYRRDRPGERPSAKGRPDRGRHRRGCAARHDRPSPSAALKPAFDKSGTITAGNASQISDGGAAVVVVSPARARALGITPLGEVVSYGQVAGPERLASAAARQRSAQGARQGRARASETWTSSRSTRRSPSSASHRWTTSASPRT